MKRKKLLFVCVSLGLGGSERCMAEMLKNLDAQCYDITLQSLIPVENVNAFPEEIKVINGYEGFAECNAPMREFVPGAAKKGQIIKLLRKSAYWFKVTYGKCDYTEVFWRTMSKYIPEMQEQFDVTIGYGPGLASLFAMNKVANGGKKILWVNTNLVRAGFDLKYHHRLYRQTDRIVMVCHNLLRDMQGYYPDCVDKMSVFYDILDVSGIRAAGNAYQAEYPEEEKNRILTVGRICEAKALHLAVEAAEILKRRGFSFRWYIIGDGELRPQLEAKINDLDVQDRMVLLGALRNPYPWFKDCDLYVQTSVYEGSCTTITEALIFGKCVVTTDIDIAFEKIEEGKNGLICGMTGEEIAQKIGILLENKEYWKQMQNYISGNPVFCGDDVSLFNQMVNDLCERVSDNRT